MGMSATLCPEDGPPPSYEEANDPNASPPSYDLIFGLKELHQSSSSSKDFYKKLFIILFGTVGCSVVIVITLVIPVAMVVIGSLYIDKCPAEHYVPIYLIVGGVVGLLKQLFSLYRKGQETQSRDEAKYTLESTFQSLINCFLLGWFMTGCFWVYRIFEPVYDDPSAPNYCNKSLYYFAFWLLTATYAIIGLTIVVLCCASIGFMLVYPK